MSNSNPTPQPNAQDEEVLKLVASFGFKFFGYDEGNNTLVVAPNGQIVLLSVAYNFVKAQMAKTAGQGGGPEMIPQMPSMPSSIDTKAENNIEQSAEKGIERQAEKQKTSLGVDLQVKPKAPPVAIKAAPESPYGDSMKLSFNPSDLNKTLSFISSNSKKSKTTSAKWLAEQFKKFLEEQRLAA